MAFLKVLLAVLPFAASAVGADPLGKVIELLDDLTAKVIKEGEAEMKAFKEYTEWCDDAARNAKFAVEDGTKQKAKLEAQIGEFGSAIEVAETEIEKLAASVGSLEKELEAANSIRKKEAADFAAAEKELMETVDMLSRGIAVIEREMEKNPAAFAQIDASSVSSALQGLSAVLEAASLSNADRSRLQALVQTQQQSAEEADDDAPGAPAAAAYKSHSGSIMDALEDLKDKAEGQLSDLRKAETNARHNHEMMAQSLEAQKANDAKHLEEEKSAKAEAQEVKATAEGELETTVKGIKTSTEELESTQAACMTTAADHEASIHGRDEELKVIAQAKKILEETSAGAVSQTYSFAQLSARAQTSSSLAHSRVVSMVRKLAQKQHSAALAQLASRIASFAKYGAANGEDPFAKVKGLIEDMIAKLERQAHEEAEEKAYCDEQMANTEAKKGDLEDDIEKMTAKIDTAASRSAELKDEVKVLQKELAALSKEQAEMDKIRQETHADYVQAKADLELGLNGVRRALQVLRDYYASAPAAFVQDERKFVAMMQQPAAPEKHSKATGAGQSIIGILEVCESDFASNLAKEESEESDAQDEYEKMTQDNKVTKTTKDQDVKYKTQESKSLDKTAGEISSDRDTANTEYAAVMDYFAKIKDRCIAKPETYETRKARREAEIEGLKQALATLEDETAFVQRKRRGGLRGSIQA